MATLDAVLGRMSSQVARMDDRLEAMDYAQQAAAAEREQARGVKPWHVFLPVVPAGTIFAFPPAPQGFMWDLRVVTVVLAAADAVNVFLGDPGAVGSAQITNRPPIGPGSLSTSSVTTQSVIVNGVNFASHAFILNPGDRVIVASNTQNISWAFLSANSLIAERVGAYIS